MHTDDKAATTLPASAVRRGGDTPSSEALEPPAPPPSAPPEAPRRRWLAGVAWLALLLAAAAGAAGYFVARQLGAQQQSQSQRLEELGAALQAAHARGDELAARLAQVETEFPGVTAELARVGELLQREARQRVEPADVERLLRMANDSLQLEGDGETALFALRSADRRLQALGDPLFAEVRRRLAQEITALAAVPRPDIAGMAYTLGSLQGEVGALLLKRESPVRPAAEPAPAAGVEPARWRALLRDMWATLKGLVVVRHREGNEPPLLAPGEQVFLTQNLYLKLESARLALLSRDDRNFHASLAAVQSWLRDYYDAGSVPVAAFAARIHELEQADVAPALPDITASLQALQAALERRRAAGVPTRGGGGR